MRRVSTYLVIIVIFGILVSGFWVQQKYFKNSKAQYITENVVRGSIEEMVKARGEVVSEKEFALGFPFSGIVERIYVRDGEKVKQGTPLVKLDTKDLEIEKNRLTSAIAQATVNLEKLKSGYTKEDLNILSARVSSARVATNSAVKTLQDANIDAYAKTDDSIRTKLDAMFSNPKSEPQLSFPIADQQLSIDIQNLRKSFGYILETWKRELDSNIDIETKSTHSQENLKLMNQLTEKLGLALNDLMPNDKVTQTSIEAWRVSVSASRTVNNTSITTLSSATEKYKAAASALTVAEEEQSAKQAGTRPEDLEIAKLQIQEAQSARDAVSEKIKQSVLLAPYDAVITKIHYDSGEIFSLGTPAVTASLNAQKIQSNISELDIGKIKEESNSVRITLDAFPDEEFWGKVTLIDAMPVIDGTDKYFRANIFFAVGTSTVRIRPGMSADVFINTSKKDNVLLIPEIGITRKEGKSYASILENNGKPREIEVKTGISDGDRIEIKEGLKENDRVIIVEN